MRNAYLTILALLAMSSRGYPASSPAQTDPDTGRLVRIANDAAGEAYPLERWRFEIQLEGVTLTPESARQRRSNPGAGELRFSYDYPDYRVDQLYRIPAVKGFAEYILRISRKDKRPFAVANVDVGFIF